MGSHQAAGGDQLHGNFTPAWFSCGCSHCLRRLHAGKRYHARTVTEQEYRWPYCRSWPYREPPGISWPLVLAPCRIKQHRCLFIDMIPKEHPTSPAVHVNVCFDPRLSQFLFLSSWKDFDMLCSDPYIQAIRRQISSVWESLLPDDPVLSHDDEAELKDLFLSLDAALQECYLPILNRLVGNISTCIFNSEAASSNYFRIEKLTFGNGKCGHFIGSGCFLNDSYTDKLSLYLPNERHRITIFDLCFGKYLDDENCNAISYTNTERF